ncbi:Mercury transport protein MerC [Caulobacteraceae bacterium]|jgi:hypothetical protein
MANPTAFVRLLDASAVGLSGLCLAHCLALPVAAAFLPVLGTWAEAEWVHLAFLAAAVPISTVALVRSGGWKAPVVLGLALIGIGLLMSGALFANEGVELAMTVAGGLALATAHTLNWRRLGHRH